MINIKNIIQECITESILNEGVSDIAYHFTNTSGVIDILKTNKFYLTATMGTVSDANPNKNRFFYMSTTRSKSTGYNMGDCKIVLNAQKISHNYKFIPVDYWQYSKNPSDWGNNKNAYTQALKSSEQEDRIVSHNSEISNATSYILKIHVINNKYIKPILAYAKQYNIEVAIYSNRNDFLNEINPIQLSDIPETPKSDNDTYVSHRQFDYRLASFIAYNDDAIYNKISEYLNDEEKIKKLDSELEKNTINYYKKFATYSYETITVISTDIHNIKSDPKKDSRFLLSLLANDMRKKNVTNISQYLKIKQTMGKNSIDFYLKKLYSDAQRIINTRFLEFQENDLDQYIEIDNNYYNYASESKELFNVIYNKYCNELKELIKSIIFSGEYNILENPYMLSKYYNLEKFNYENIDITKELNITNMSYKYEDNMLNKKIHDMFYWIIYDMDQLIPLAKQYDKEYNEQFY